jgi:hypothetical protein
MPFDLSTVLKVGSAARKGSLELPGTGVDEFTRAPTGLWKPLDYLNRLSYPVQNVLRRATDPDKSYSLPDYLKSVGAGVMGKERSMFSDVMTNVGWKPTTTTGKIGKAVVGLAGDILLDPTTYAGGFMTKLGKAGAIGKMFKVGDKLIDVTRDADKLFDVARAAGATAEHIDEIAGVLKGINNIERTKNLVSTMAKIGVEIKPWAPAATAAKQFEEGSRRLLNLTLPGFMGGGQVSAKIPGEAALWKAATAANAGIKAKEASFLTKMATGGIPSTGESLAAGVGNLKRAFSILPTAVKRISQGARGETQLHAKLMDEMITAGGGVPKTALDAKQTEAVELLGGISHLLPENWKAIDDPELLKGHLITALEQSTFSDKRKSRVLATLPTFEDPQDIRRALNLREVTERGNVQAGLTSYDSAVGRLEKSGAGNAEIAYVPHTLEASARKIGAFRGSSGSTKPRAHSIYQTVYEAQEGIVDPKVEEYLLRHKNKVVVKGSTGKKYTGEQLIETMHQPLPFESNFTKLSEQQFAKQLPTINRRTFSNSLAEFGRPMADTVDPGNAAMARLYDQQYLGWLHRVHPKEYDRIIHTQLPAEIYLASQNFLHIEKNPGAFWNTLKSFGDLIKPWLLVSPGFHTRNFVSSLLMTHVGGDNILSPRTAQLFGENLGLLLDQNKTRVINGVEYRGKDLFDLYVKSTGESSLSATAIFGDAATFKNEKGLAGKVGKAWMAAPKVSREVGNKIETAFRFNHFVNRIADGATPAAAAESVAKHFYDYAELSPSERKLQAIIPFYSWMRKNTEANLRYLLDDPAYMAAPSKVKSELETASDKPPYNEENLPDWLKARGQVRMPWQGHKGEPIYGTGQGWLPQLDAPMFMKAAGGDTKDLVNNILQSIHPVLQKPIELSLNKSFLTGREIAPTGDESQTFYGVPGIPKKAIEVAGLVRPLREIDRLTQIGGADYRKKGGGFSEPPRAVEAVRFATGLKGYSMPEERVLIDRYRQVSAERTNLRYLARKYADTPKAERINKLLAATEAEYAALKQKVGPLLQKKKPVGTSITDIMNRGKQNE